MSHRFVSTVRRLQCLIPVLAAILVLFGSGAALASAQNLAFTPGIAGTVAGDPTEQGSESGASYTGLASGLVMNYPIGAAYDAAGNLYILEEYSSILRVVAGKNVTSIPTLPGVTVQPGHTYTLAGSGTNCANPTDTDNGDGCPAPQSILDYPLGIAIDTYGNVFIADDGPNEIRVIYAGGTLPGLTNPQVGYIYSYASFPNSNLTLVAVDAQENVYYSDGSSNLYVIYSGKTATGNPLGIPDGTAPGTTINLTQNAQDGCSYSNSSDNCGDGGPLSAAGFSMVGAISVDPSGNIYVVDTYPNDRIRAIYVAGTLPGVQNPTVGDIYTVAGGGTGNSVPLLGAPATSINIGAAPSVPGFDAAGDVYFGLYEGGNQSVAEVNQSGLMTVVFGGLVSQNPYAAYGDGAWQFTGICSQSTDVMGDGCAATSAGLGTVSQVAVDSSGNLYITDSSTNLIRESAVASSAEVFAGTAGLPLSNGAIFVSNPGLQPLQLSAIGFTGPFAQAATGGPSDCSASTALAAGESCPIGITVTNASVGSVSGSITVNSNAPAGANTATLNGTIVQASTTTTITAVSPAYPTVTNAGQPVTFNITVAPPLGDTLVPSGTVTLLNGTTTVGTGTLNNGAITVQLTTLPAGTDNITASYGGDTNFTASTSYLAPVNIAASSSPVANVALAASPSSATSGQSVTLTATVTAQNGSPVTSGTVTFEEGGNALGAPVSLNSSGTATFATTALPAGQNGLEAYFNGTSSYAANASNVVTVAIGGGAELTFAPGVLSIITGEYGSGGYTGDGGPANNAQIDTPASVVADSYGNVFFIDKDNDSGVNTIRVIASGKGTIPGISNPVAGDIYTIAGQGTCGAGASSCGDGGPASQAQFSYPTTISTDNFGNLYIIDNGSNGSASAVRKIDTSGTIHTVAGILKGFGSTGYSGDGGPAINAKINANSVFVDNAGNLLIADNRNNLIRRVDAQTGIITTVAGLAAEAGQTDNYGDPLNSCSATPCGDGGLATSALLSNPTFVAVDATGNLYINDTADCAIRKVDASTGIINTVAGVMAAGCTDSYTGDGGPATAATFEPQGLLLDNAGDMYITTDRRIREVSASTGIINTIVGGGSCSGVSCSGSPATAVGLGGTLPFGMDGDGNLYLGDSDAIDEVATTATAVNFGQLNLGTDNTQLFTVNNIGTQPLTFTGLTVATTSPTPGPSPSDFAQLVSGGTDCTASTSLAAGATCNIDAQWFPTIASAETGTFTVASNATNAISGNNVITLSGTGLGSSGSTPQTITFPALKSSYTYGSTIPLAATTNATDSTLTISYRVSGPATLNGTTLTAAGVGTVTVTAYQFGNAQYASAASQSQTFTVTQAPLTVTAASISINVGSAVPQPTYTITGFVGSDTQASVVTGAPTLTITNPSGGTIAVGSVPVDGSYPIVVAQNTLSAGANYSLNLVNGTLSVTGAQQQTITFGALSNVTYGVTPITLSAYSVGTLTNTNTGLTITYTVTGPATIAGNLLTITGAGAIAVTATQNGDADYGAATPVTQSFTASPALLTVTAGNLTVAQNAPLPNLTADYAFSGFVNGDTSAAVTGTPVLTTTATDTTTLGTYPITIAQGALSSTNYTFTFVPGTLTVVQGQAQTISFPAIASAVYGTSAITLGAKASSNLGVTYAVTSGPATVAGSVLTITGAGSITVTASQPGSSSYAPATPVSQTFTVAPATLTLTANSATRMNDEPNPTFTYTLTGFVNGDTQNTATSGAPYITTTAAPGSPVGSYPIIPAAQYTNGNGALVIAMTSTNYTFLPVNGTLTISSGGPAANYTLTATPQQLNVIAGNTVQTTITLMPQNYYQGLVTLSCGTLPTNVQCAFSPASISPDGTAAIQTTTLTIITNSSQVVVPGVSHSGDTGTRAAAIFLPGSLATLLLVFRRRKLLKGEWSRQLMILAVLLTSLGGLAACGGGASSSASSTTAAPGTYSITVMAKGQDGTTNTVPVSIQVL